MAAKEGVHRSPSKSCKSLLRELNKGQNALRNSIMELQPPKDVTATSQKLLMARKLERRCRDSLTIDLSRISNIPKKRARLVQLTPEYEVSNDNLG